MPEILLNSNQQGILIEKLVTSLLSVDKLKDWLQRNLPAGLAQLTGGSLEQELSNLMTWAASEDGLRSLLQKLADRPPNNDPEVGPIVFALTLGKIKQQRKTISDLPSVLPHESWFAADRPFVNRRGLREHLRDLDDSVPGPRCILVVDGEDRRGKTFGVSLAMGCQPPEDVLPTIDFDQYALAAVKVDARELATLIVGDDVNCPPYDPTKESASLPGLMFWLKRRLKTKHLWIIMDHCKRKVATDGAKSLIRDLAVAIQAGELPRVRLILVDFDRNDLPQEFRDNVRYDRADLPDLQRVKEWCEQLAAAAKRKHDPADPLRWATEVFSFSQVKDFELENGTWQMELERKLRRAVETIMACEAKP
jgi:hypothetical protein